MRNMRNISRLSCIAAILSSEKAERDKDEEGTRRETKVWTSQQKKYTGIAECCDSGGRGGTLALQRR